MVNKKLGIAYNIFDGEELLPFSLLCVRDVAHYIVVVYQITSNYGKRNKELVPLLKTLEQIGLIDELVYYEPSLEFVDERGNKVVNVGSLNEQTKRNIGLEKCIENECGVFSSMDADEMYVFEDYNKALNIFIEGGYDSSFCQMETYYKLPDMKVVPPETYYVPLFYNVMGKRSVLKFSFIENYNLLCDGTRQIKAGYPKIFSRDEIQMHHYSYVRNDISSKVYNSSSQMPESEKEKVIEYFNSWRVGKMGYLIGKQIFNLAKTENLFNIKFNEYTNKIELPKFVANSNKR